MKKHGGLDEALEIEREKFRDFLRKRNWPSLDLYTLFKAEPAKYTLREDGIHLNREGHRVFAEKMFELMEKILYNLPHDT